MRAAPRPLGLAVGFAVLAGLIAGCTLPQARRLRRFEATLAAHDSATAALEEWCAANGLGQPPQVTATVVEAAPPPEPGDARRLLGVAADAPLAYRHVRLTCGPATLSLAHNWYVPERLSPAMNRTLATTHVPFGKVAAPLGYRRERLGTLPRNAPQCPPGTVLAHRAVLRLPDGRGLALLVECYTAANLGD